MMAEADHPLSGEQATFIATLPDVFSDLPYAIRVYAYLNRSAPIDASAARQAIEVGVRLGFVDESNGMVRLAEPLRRLRDAWAAAGTCPEDGVFELADWILARAGR